MAGGDRERTSDSVDDGVGTTALARSRADIRPPDIKVRSTNGVGDLRTPFRIGLHRVRRARCCCRLVRRGVFRRRSCGAPRGSRVGRAVARAQGRGGPSVEWCGRSRLSRSRALRVQAAPPPTKKGDGDAAAAGAARGVRIARADVAAAWRLRGGCVRRWLCCWRSRLPEGAMAHAMSVERVLPGRSARPKALANIVSAFLARASSRCSRNRWRIQWSCCASGVALPTNQPDRQIGRRLPGDQPGAPCAPHVPLGGISTDRNLFSVLTGQR